MKKTAFFGLLAFLFFACSTASKKPSDAASGPKTWKPDFTAGPPTIVYRTKTDFADRVPVVLSADKKRVLSYPSAADLAAAKKPVALAGGYLLDQKGIGARTAYLSTTWAEWSTQKTTPSPAEMLGPLLLEADPFLEICDCGNRFQFKNAVAEINAIIESGQLGKCKKL